MSGRVGSVSARYRRLASRALTVIVVITVLAAIYDYVVLAARGQFNGQMEDFGDRMHPFGGLLAGPRNISAGSDPYTAWIAFTRNHLVIFSDFDYPPLIGWLTQPLLSLDMPVREALWLGLSLLCVLGGAVAIAVALLPRGWPRVRLGLLAPLVFGPAQYNLDHGNVGSIAMLFFGLAALCWMRGWEIRCGTAIALAAAIKVAPAFLLVLFFRRRWWRGLAAAVIIGGASLLAGAVLVPGPALHDYLVSVLPVLARGDGWITNQSAAAVLSRLADHSVLVLDPESPLLRILAGASELALIVVTGLAVARSASIERRAAEFALASLTIVLASTTSWYATHIAMLAVFAALPASLRLLPRPRARVLAIAVLGLALSDAIVAPVFLNAVPSIDLFAVRASGWWWLFLQAVSLPALAAVAVWLTLARSISGTRLGLPAATIPPRTQLLGS